MNKCFFVFLILILIFGCISSKETLINPINDDAKKMIEEAELLLLDYKVSNDKYDIQKTNLIIKKLNELSKNNKLFEAKVIGLIAERDIAINNHQKIEWYITEIEKRNKKEEKLYVIKSGIAGETDEKIKILMDGIKKTEENNYLKLLLAENYFKKGNFDKSINLFDEAFVKLPGKYRDVYGFSRDLAYKFVKNPPEDIKIIDILSEKEVTFNQIIEMLFIEADFLPADIFDRRVPASDLFKKMISHGYINFRVAGNVNLDSKLKRKDFAYFLVYLSGRLEKNPGLINKYAKTYSLSSDDFTPVKDVDVKEYYFPAVLVVIERELMDLPDGERFCPDNGVSGLELYEIIKKLNVLY